MELRWPSIGTSTPGSGCCPPHRRGGWFRPGRQRNLRSPCGPGRGCAQLGGPFLGNHDGDRMRVRGDPDRVDRQTSGGARRAARSGVSHGHVTSAAALAAVAALIMYRRWGARALVATTPLALLLPAVMALAVIRLQFHFFTDTVMGRVDAAWRRSRREDLLHSEAGAHPRRHVRRDRRYHNSDRHAFLSGYAATRATQYSDVRHLGDPVARANLTSP